jgi:hypothetical protein
MLDDSLFGDVFCSLTADELHSIVGFVTSHGGMTCHTAVTSRGMGKTAIGIASHADIGCEFKFAGINRDTLLLHPTFPQFAIDTIGPLLTYQIQKNDLLGRD